MNTGFPKLLMALLVFSGYGAGTARAQTQPAPDSRPGAIDDTALQELRAAAEASHSDAVVILQDGETVAEWYFGKERRPIETMSVLKSIVGLAAGRLVTLKKIDSLDQPVCEIYPEWNQGSKKQITIRHLLNHTSGLQDNPNAGVEIYPSPDAIQLALAAELSEPPGSKFRYNNKAVNLLAGIIEKTSGQPMDEFIEQEFFQPLEIDEFKWYYDRSGSPHAMAGLELHARDLAKFGQLVLADGQWAGKQLVSKEFLQEMLAQSQPGFPRYGLLWWRHPASTRYIYDETQRDKLAGDGVSREALERLTPLLDSRFSERSARDKRLREVLGADWQSFIDTHFDGASASVFRIEYGEFKAFYANGFLGQMLLVIPGDRIVAVRQIAQSDRYNPQTDGFRDFAEKVLNLTGDPDSSDPEDQLKPR